MAAMKSKEVLFVLLTLVAPQITLASDPDVNLHCKGKSWRTVAGNEELPTDAVLRLDRTGTYISVSAVGSGISAETPRAVSDVERAGSIKLKSAATNQPPIDAWFNINRYTGELIVAPTGGGKILFLGSCRKADPLF